MAFDVSQPENPSSSRPFSATRRTADFDGEGEFPERLDFVPALASPTGNALLLVTNEMSGNTRAFELSAPQ